MSDDTGAPDAGQDDDDDTLPEAPVSVTGKEKYREPTAYEKRLRSENAKWRERARAAEQAFKDTQTSGKGEWEQKLAEARAERDAAIAAEKAERERLLNEAKERAERGVHEARTAAERRIVRAEVRAEAIKAGLVHTKGLDMLDLTEAKLDEHGNLVLPDGFFEKAKAEMPFLFAEPKQVQEPAKPQATSNPTQPPPATPPTKKRGMEMTPEEWKAAERALMQGLLP